MAAESLPAWLRYKIRYPALDVPDDYALTEFIPEGVAGYQELGGVGAGGDSGGGWYIDGEVFAITSFEIGSPGYYGDTGATMLSLDLPDDRHSRTGDDHSDRLCSSANASAFENKVE